MTDKESIADLIAAQPLYKKVIVETEFLNNPNDIEDLSFSFYCPNENSQQTFKLVLEPNRFLRSVGGKMTNDEFISYFDSLDPESMKYKFTQHYSATCQYCFKYRTDFLLQVESDKYIPLNNVNAGNKDYQKPKQIVKKIGQFPPYQISPDKDFLNFLNEEDKDNYKKALMCRSQNYGIAAFAYLRRIIENEMIRIVEDLSKIDRPESTKINQLISAFKENHIMTKLIEGIYEYLPSSLKSLGDNPLKLLYSQLSGGIHEFSEEECSEKADKVDMLLKFVIKKITEENSEVKAVRDAIKNLR